jgi:hypothetical protein
MTCSQLKFEIANPQELLEPFNRRVAEQTMEQEGAAVRLS